MSFEGPSTTLSPDLRESLIARYLAVRSATTALAEPLSPEDQLLQSMPQASPTKWHLAHTTWFFDKLVLAAHGKGRVDRDYDVLWNSYYESFGRRHPRHKRGVLSRPSCAEVASYRERVDQRMVGLLRSASHDLLARLLPLVELGIAHEEQHQELVLTDILHAFSENPRLPIYREADVPCAPTPPAEGARYVEFSPGLYEIGAAPEAGFCFDNETPSHRVWVDAFALRDRLVTVAELRAFMRDGGYRTPSLWLAEGFDFVTAARICAPAYVQEHDGELFAFGLGGLRPLSDAEPVSHVSYYEADAIARYLGARLPTEAQWEIAARASSVRGNFVESKALRPLEAQASTEPLLQLYGDVWEWTSSSYEPYPGHRAPPGPLGEYNAKFMVNQRVLRGGSCLSPSAHLRATYRNFWPPETRFQMSGFRLAMDLVDG